MAVTQKDIADALGVSTVTVSRALREHADLSEQTKRKVMETAERLGYLKHRAARPMMETTVKTRKLSPVAPEKMVSTL